MDTPCPCDRADLNPLDRLAVDERLRRGEALADLTAGAAIALPALVLATAAPDERAVLDDLLLAAESMAVTGLLTQGVKTLVGRPYPYLYGDHYPGQDHDGVNYAAFWSGHTAVPMAGAVTMAYLYQRRNPYSTWRWVLWTAGPALALASGTLQITARNHFPTDVVAGGAAGAAVGFLNPWLRTLW